MSGPRPETGLHWLVPDWPAPPSVRALTTTRQGGVSGRRYASLNLADHVGDDPQRVAENRFRLQAALSLAAEPVWLRQQHGSAVVEAAEAEPGPAADASYTAQPGLACAVLTADCLPILLCDVDATVVAAVHAGWRGLLTGVIEATVRRLPCPGERLLAWLGPAIGPQAFEVGEAVRRAFLEEDAAAEAAFQPGLNGRWLADLYALARRRLARCALTAVYGGRWCTVSDADRFYSYRRDGTTGRMATLIWRSTGTEAGQCALPGKGSRRG